jgi:5'(3')-deoxyribonucleotidase
MKKLRILVDIDSIVADTLPYWLDRIGKDTGVYAKVEDITLWDMAKCPPLTQVDPRSIFGVLQDPGFIENIPPISGAANVLELLKNDGHEIYLVTARHGPVSMPETLNWIRKHLPFLSAEKQVVFLYDKNLIPADIIIDDKAETVEKYVASHPKAWGMAIEYPYNAHLKGRERITVVSREMAWPNLFRTIRTLASGGLDRLTED